MEMNDTNKKLIAMGIIAVILLAGVIVIATKNTTSQTDNSDEQTAKYIADKFNEYNSDNAGHIVRITFDGGDYHEYNWNGQKYGKFSSNGTWVCIDGKPTFDVSHISSISWR